MAEPIKDFTQTFFHGTKAQLKLGDLITIGYRSNNVSGYEAKYVYVTSNLSVAVWGAELALGNGAEQIYIVEATGPIEDDPNVTDKRFPGNPTRSYRTKSPLRVVGVVSDWVRHSPEDVLARKEGIAQIMRNGGAIIED